MKIHLASPRFCYRSFKENAEDFCKHFQYFELLSEYELDLTRKKEELREVMDSYDMGFQVHAPFSDINPASINPKFRKFSVELVRQNIEACADLGIKMITAHPGYKTPLSRFHPEKVVEMNRVYALELEGFQEEYGVTVGFENMPYQGKLECATLAEMMEVIEGTNLPITLDIGHAHQVGVIDEFKELRERIVNIHIHDNLGDKDGHLVLGEGNCPFEKVLKDYLPLPNPKYDNALVIEAGVFEEAVRSQEYLKGLLDRLEL